MSRVNSFDVIVVGGGPGGSSCALFLAKSGLNVLLLDSQKFPRDKTCADNKTWICTRVLKDLGLYKDFLKLPKQEIARMLFSTPGGYGIEIDLDEKKIAREGPHYNVRRLVFDNFLFQGAKRHPKVTSIEGFFVTSVIKDDSGAVIGVRGHNANGRKEEKEFFSKVVVGADGSTSVVSTTAGINPVVKERHASSARAYFKGVVHDPKLVELHYLQGVCPGYFWIFPVDSGLCNVGVGIPTPQVQQMGLDLDKYLLEIISSPRFAKRFSKAKMVGSIGEWGITIGGGPHKHIVGDGFVLVGDAANTSVSFAGEGVGPAMRSGKFAAKAIVQAFKENDFSRFALSSYQRELWSVIVPENKAVGQLEFLATRPKLFDLIVKYSSGKPRLRKLASEIASDYQNASKIMSLKTVASLFF